MIEENSRQKKRNRTETLLNSFVLSVGESLVRARSLKVNEPRTRTTTKSTRKTMTIDWLEGTSRKISPGPFMCNAYMKIRYSQANDERIPCVELESRANHCFRIFFCVFFFTVFVCNAVCCVSHTCTHTLAIVPTGRCSRSMNQFANAKPIYKQQQKKREHTTAIHTLNAKTTEISFSHSHLALVFSLAQ